MLTLKDQQALAAWERLYLDPDYDMTLLLYRPEPEEGGKDDE